MRSAIFHFCTINVTIGQDSKREPQNLEMSKITNKTRSINAKNGQFNLKKNN